MDILDSIANMSMSMSQANLMNQVSTQVLSMSLDAFEGAATEITKLMESSVNPNLGSNFDIRI